MSNVAKKILNHIPQGGVATLLTATVILALASSTLIYTSKATQLEQASFRASYSSNQAFTAAEAGLEHALSYLNSNRMTLDPDQDKNVDVTVADSTTNLPNGTSYSFKIKNVNPGNLDLVRVTAIGRSNDSAQSKTITTLVSYLPILKSDYIPKVALAVRGNLNSNGSPDIYNMNSNKSLWVGGNVDIKGNLKTHNSCGVTSISNTTPSGTSFTKQDSVFSSSTIDNVLINYFGMSLSEIQSYIQQNHIYLSAGSDVTAYPNQIIWYSGNLNLSGGQTIGSASAPVTLIVDGDLVLGGNVKLYGFLFVRNDFDAANGGISLYGSTIVNGSMRMNGNTKIYYDQTMINKIRNNYGSYVKVAGSWKDY